MNRERREIVTSWMREYPPCAEVPACDFFHNPPGVTIRIVPACLHAIREIIHNVPLVVTGILGFHDCTILESNLSFFAALNFWLLKVMVRLQATIQFFIFQKEQKMNRNTSYEQKVGKRIFLIFVILAYIAMNYASNGALVKMTLTLVFDVISAIFPIVPIDQFRNPYTF